MADEALRDEVAAKHPQVWARILARCAFMRAQLGVDVADEVLSLSNIPACFMPFLAQSRLHPGGRMMIAPGGVVPATCALVMGADGQTSSTQA